MPRDLPGGSMGGFGIDRYITSNLISLLNVKQRITYDVVLSSTIILMPKCDSKYREICFNRAFIITQS